MSGCHGVAVPVADALSTAFWFPGLAIHRAGCNCVGDPPALVVQTKCLVSTGVLATAPYAEAWKIHPAGRGHPKPLSIQRGVKSISGDRAGMLRQDIAGAFIAAHISTFANTARSRSWLGSTWSRWKKRGGEGVVASIIATGSQGAHRGIAIRGGGTRAKRPITNINGHNSRA